MDVGENDPIRICKRQHKWPRRWSYSKRRRYRTRFCLRCLEQDWQELKGRRYS